MTLSDIDNMTDDEAIANVLLLGGVEFRMLGSGSGMVYRFPVTCSLAAHFPTKVDSYGYFHPHAYFVHDGKGSAARKALRELLPYLDE